MTGRLVGDDGSPSARLVLIGEAPGAQEEAHGKPFVGASGWKLQEWWKPVGLARPDFYVTNCYPYRPAGNDIKTVPADELDGWVDQLHDRLAALHDPWLIVPTGNTALRALTGKSGITKHRGSIYQYLDRRGRAVKVIPTIHPAAIFRTKGWERRCQRDWGRIAGDALFRELRLPVREHFTRPTLSDVAGFVHDVEAQAHRLAVDIETPGGTITCVGFSYHPNFSITIPTTLNYWGDESALAQAWEFVRRLCEAEGVEKITHNGHFDAFWLGQRGITLRAWMWDTLALHHAIDATEDHALAYCASVDTREPYWKDEAKDPEEAAKYASNLEAFWVYNGKDACVTRELADVYIDALKAAGRLDFYHQHYRRLFNPVLGMMRTGIRMDEQQRRRQYASLVSKSIQLQADLEVLAGTPLHTTTKNKKRDAAGKIPDLSNAKIKTFLYDTLKLPVQRNRQTKQPTADEVTVRHLMLKWGAKPLPVTAEASALAQIAGVPLTFEVLGGKILEHRRTRKLMEFLDEGLLDEDGHIRYTFKFTTDTGRFACGKSPTMRRGQRTGRNIQNIDRELRGVFLPEPGCLFLEVDLSQAEDRIVKMLAAAVTGNETLRDRARARPWENDEHKRAASVIFNTQISAVTKPQRQMGKRVRHACITPEHEVLTPWGWARIDSVKAGTPIAQWTFPGRVDFVATKAVTSYDFDGHLMSLRNTGISQVVTLDHKMPYVTNGNFKVVEAAKLPQGGKVPINGVHSGPLSPEFPPEILAAIQADAQVRGKQYEFHLRNPTKIDRLKILATQHGIQYTERVRGKDTYIYLKPSYRVPKMFGSYLLGWDRKSLHRLLDEVLHWDGSNWRHRREYTTAEKSNAIWIQTVAHLCGIQALLRTKRVKGRDYYIVSFNRRCYSYPKKELVNYKGQVWCPTVDSGFFLVRHNDTISVTGNTNYDMHGKTMSDGLLKDGIVETPDECDRMINALHAADPDIRLWQAETRRLVMTHKCLVNSWGRELLFENERLDDDAYRRAYAFIPQSEVPGLVNSYGLVPLHTKIKTEGWQTVIHLQGHDSLLMSCPPAEVWPVMEFLRTSLERPRIIGRQPLTIWTEFKVGTSWGETREWKKPPSREEVETVVEELYRV